MGWTAVREAARELIGQGGETAVEEDAESVPVSRQNGKS